MRDLVNSLGEKGSFFSEEVTEETLTMINVRKRKKSLEQGEVQAGEQEGEERKNTESKKESKRRARREEQKESKKEEKKISRRCLPNPSRK